MDASNTNAVISAASGLAGVLIGGLISFLEEIRAERITRIRSSSYLAMRVVCILDLYVRDCAFNGFICFQTDRSFAREKSPLSSVPDASSDAQLLQMF